jgi:hypothetical protein
MITEIQKQSNPFPYPFTAFMITFRVRLKKGLTEYLEILQYTVCVCLFVCLFVVYLTTLLQ